VKEGKYPVPTSNTDNSEQEYKKEFTPDTKRSVRLMLKNILLHPLMFCRTLRKHDNLEDHLDEYAHRVSFGRSDHPLDDMGPLESSFSARGDSSHCSEWAPKSEIRRI